jgi:hypothetical protein
MSPPAFASAHRIGLAPDWQKIELSAQLRSLEVHSHFARHKSILTTAIHSHPTDEDLLRAVDGMPC